MKKYACLAVAVVSLGCLGAASLITQAEAIVSGALTELKFESIVPKAGLVGAPPRFRITRQTLDHIVKLLNDEKIIEVQANGAVKVVDVKK